MANTSKDCVSHSAVFAMLAKRLAGWERLVSQLDALPAAARTGWWYGQRDHAIKESAALKAAIDELTNGTIQR